MPSHDHLDWLQYEELIADGYVEVGGVLPFESPEEDSDFIRRELGRLTRRLIPKEKLPLTPDEQPTYIVGPYVAGKHHYPRGRMLYVKKLDDE